MKNFKPTLTFLPDMVTSFNLFTGFLSILMVTRGQITAAAWLILLSLVWDSLDGNIARMFKNPTRFGQELDSLSDLVSFVAAPALIAGNFFMHSLNLGSLFVLYLFLAAGAFRLARFNIQPSSKDYFEGLSTPAAGITLNMLMLASIKNGWNSQWFVVPLILLLAWLMVSQVRYPKITTPFSQWQALFYGSIFLFGILLFTLNLETALAGIHLYFVFLGPLCCLSSYRIKQPLPLPAKD